jgi:FAD:protein FMN transferase
MPPVLPEKIRPIRFSAMGTACALYVCESPKKFIRGLRAAVSEVHRIEAKYSRYLPASTLSEINRQASVGGAIELDEETAALFEYAARCYELSDGLFDITSGVLRRVWDFRSGGPPNTALLDATLPLLGFAKLQWSRPVVRFPLPGMELDFGGLAKEYAVDRVVAVCRDAGILEGLVDLGGDVGVIGTRLGQPWMIGISSPDDPAKPFATISLTAGALASSGNYARYIEYEGKRYSHVVNPITGWPIEEISAVSCVSDKCLAAGSFSTIAMLKGQRGVEWLRSVGVPHAWANAQKERGCSPPFALIST